MQGRTLIRHAAVPLAIFAGLAISLAVSFVLWRLETHKGDSAYETQALTAISLVRSRIAANLEIVDSLVSLYRSSTDVSRAEFHTFASPVLDARKGIQALEWVPRVGVEERAAYEQRARRDGHLDFQIHEMASDGTLAVAPRREEYFPAFYIEPSAGNEAALGLDLSSEQTRWRALQRARHQGAMQASEPVTLVQDESRETGVLVFAPVFDESRGASGAEAGERHPKLLGFAVGVFRLRDLIHAALSSAPGRHETRDPGIDLYLYDEDVSDARRLLVVYRTSDPYRQPQPIPEGRVRSFPHFAEPIMVAGRQWTLVAIPRGGATPGPVAWLAGAFLVVGLGFTAALGAYLLVNEHRTRVVGQLAEARATELNAAREELRSRTLASEAADATVTELRKLAKYLSPQVYASISAGHKPVEITSQRKKLTVLFCDIANFTQTVEELASEDVTLVLNRYLSDMSEIGLQHQATIDKYVGDGIMMFLGDPETKGVREDALTCVTMAMAMQEHMHDLQQYVETLGLGVSLHARIGISTGYCMVGNFGSEHMMNYTIVGAGVNLASRLQTAAPVGHILVSEDTYHLVKDDICCEAHGAIDLKGLPDSALAYRVMGLQPDTDERDIVMREDSPGIKLELDPHNLTDAERQQALRTLRRAVSRLVTASNGTGVNSQ